VAARKELLGVLVILSLAGCRPGGDQGITIATAVELLPDALYQPQATLNYGGTPVLVEMKREAAGQEVRFLLSAHGEVLETEVYRSSTSEFSLISIDERFEPPLPLLMFPMTLGKPWEWAGELVAGGVRHGAKATISPSTEQLFLTKTGGVDTVKIDVDLKIDSKTSTPAKRHLTFWFARGKGIVKREIGTATSREPSVP
jgi:hypothetical protein